MPGKAFVPTKAQSKKLASFKKKFDKNVVRIKKIKDPKKKVEEGSKFKKKIVKFEKDFIRG